MISTRSDQRPSPGARGAASPGLLPSLLILCLLPAGCARPAGPVSAADAPPNGRGAELFELHCQLCHGTRGEADGPASYLLFPPARDFSRGRFKLAGTSNGAPSDEDFLRTLRRGIPGSAMPSWDWMPEEDLVSLARHVRGLAADGWVRRQSEATTTEEQRLELQKLAVSRLIPGQALEVGSPAPDDPGTRELGAQLFAERCASCHGEDGRGRPETVRRNSDDTLNWARDFTSGALKGGSSHADLSRRLQLGMHGTAMPASDLEEGQRAAVIAHVQSLIPGGSEERLVQRRQVLRAARVDEVLDLGSGTTPWAACEELELALAPLWWKRDAVLGASVAALHDGETLAIRVRWPDPTPDAPRSREAPHPSPPYADAVALQLTSQVDPPLFGMGDSPALNIWHWRASDVFDTEGLRSILAGVPHRRGDWLDPGGTLDVPLYQQARGTAWVSGESISVRPEGMRNIESQHPTSTRIEVLPSWRAGEWQVVLSRKLQPERPGELELDGDGPLSISFAIWNGAIGDLRGQKSITIWHQLVLER